MADTITLAHANTFFFVTTIAVVIGIILLLVLTGIFVRILKSVKVITARVEKVIDKTSDHIENSAGSKVVQNGLPFLISVVNFFNKKKKVTKK